MGSTIGNPGFDRQFEVGDEVRLVDGTDAITIGDVLPEHTFTIDDVNEEGKFALINLERKEELKWFGWWELLHVRNGVDWLVALL